MKRFFLIFVCCILFFVCDSEAKAQELIIRVNEPFVTGSLSGVVTDRNGEFIFGVSVKRYDSRWKKSLGSTSTDENGKFEFSRMPAGLYFLKLSYKGFQEMEIKIRVIKKSKKKLVVKMEVAT